MAPRRGAAALAAKPCLLLELSHDEVGVVAHELCDPLRPLLAVHLSSTAKGLRVPMQAALVQLKQQRQEAEAFAALLETRIVQLCGKPHFRLGSGYGRPLTLAHWRTFGTLVGCGSLPILKWLYVAGSDRGDEVLALLAAGLRHGGLPLLFSLRLMSSQIGDQGASALASALTTRAVPRLSILFLSRNKIGDSGLLALAPALRQLPTLKVLSLFGNEIGDRGLAALLAQPMTGLLESLEELHLSYNQITEAGCIPLASILHSGALPALNYLGVVGDRLDETSPVHKELSAARDGLVL